MADRWIVSTHWYTEHMTLERAESQARVLQSKFPKKNFKVYRIKTTLKASNTQAVIEELEKRIAELSALKRRKPKL